MLSENINKQDIDGVFWENVISDVERKECPFSILYFIKKR